MSGLPKINITFREAAKKAVIRSERGVVGLILKESTEPSTNPIVVTSPSEIPSTISSANQKQIALALIGYNESPRKVVCYFVTPTTETVYTYTAVTPEAGANPKTSGWYEKNGDVYALTNDETVQDNKTYYTRSSSTETTINYEDALAYMLTVSINYIAAPTAETDGATTTIKTWIESIHDSPDENYGIVAVLPNTTANSEFVVNYAAGTVKDDEDNSYTTEAYCSRIAGLLATTPLNRSSTYADLPELAACAITSREEAGTANDAGKFIVFWDGEKVKAGRGVNSLTTTTETKSAAYKKIKIIDTMMLIKKDIARAAEDSYIGKYTNNYDNKMLLVTAINDYFAELIRQGALNSGTCEIDIDANRKYLRDKGIDVSEMTDQDIKIALTDEQVFLSATVGILDAMEDITLDITI